MRNKTHCHCHCHCHCHWHTMDLLYHDVNGRTMDALCHAVNRCTCRLNTRVQPGIIIILQFLLMTSFEYIKANYCLWIEGIHRLTHYLWIQYILARMKMFTDLMPFIFSGFVKSIDEVWMEDKLELNNIGQQLSSARSEHLAIQRT